MAYIENIVVGKLLVEPECLFAYDYTDWEYVEKEKTLFTQERYLPKIMVECGIVKSANEVRRNQPKLCITLGNSPDFKEIKWGKRKLWIAIGV